MDKQNAEAPLRRSARLQDKQKARSHSPNASRNSEMTTFPKEAIDDKGNSLVADSKEKCSLKGSTAGGSRNSRRSSIFRRQKQAEIDAEIKKLELEQQMMKRQQEIVDLQLARQLADMEEENSEEDISEGNSGSEVSESVVSEKPNITKWVKKGDNPWSKKNIDYGKQANTSKEQISNFLNSKQGNQAIYSTPNQFEDPNLVKILTRQSIPKELPIFSGDPSEWPNFIYQFRHSTSICGFSNEENQIRLQKCLKGQAKRIVQSLLILPSNVEHVIKLLENRFGRSEQIIFMLIDKIKGLPVIKDDKIDTFINFADEIQNLVAIIETLKEEDHLRNPILLQELLNKLPMSYRLSWVEYITELQTHKKVTKLREFSLWLDKKANVACQLQNLKFDIHDDKFQKSGYQNVKRSGYTLSTGEIKKKKCLCCGNDYHKLENCSKFKTLLVNDRWAFVTKNKVCFCCLIPFHNIKYCRNRKICAVVDCHKTHHTLLHNNSPDTNPNNPTSHTEVNCHIGANKSVLLKILPVVLFNGNAKIDTFALLDDASTVTLIDQDLADTLDLSGPKHSLCLQWTNNQTKEQDDSRVVCVKISSPHTHDRSFYLRHVRTIKGLALPRQTINIDEISIKYPYINKHMTSMTEAQPKILIGQDNWPLLVSRQTLSGPWHGPALSKTPLGWVIHGNYYQQKNDVNFPQHVCHINLKAKDDLDLLHDMVKEQWKIDTCFDFDQVAVSREDLRAQKILDSTMRRVGEKFETGLLWKYDNVILPKSKTNALQRLYCTERKMDKNLEFGKAYCDKIADMEDKGYIKKLSSEELKISSEKEWYLPHFGVLNPNKKKLRIVFDASSRANGKSLNDFLLTGPDLYNSLQTILLNFRIKQYAFTADIKEMFLQVLVRKEDRASQRILYRGMDRSKTPDIYEINVVFFGSTSGPCLAQEAKNRNAKEFIGIYPQAVNDILYSHFMDDYLGTADSIEEAKQLVGDIIYVHKKGGFSICNWMANDRKILEDVDTSLLATCFQSLDRNETISAERILGVWWDPSEDNFCFRAQFHKIDQSLLNKTRRPTKREMLKIVMSVFDPLGFLSNFIIQGKILLQGVWRSKIGWDDEIPETVNIKWEKWIDGLQEMSKLLLPRQYCPFTRSSSTIQLHVFCDASENAYSSVAYLRWEAENNVRVCFLMSKTRVAPLKPMSIPRLELQAALAGARLGYYLKSTLQLEISKCFYWSDSKTVLHWIKSEARRFKIFIAQRVGEIQERTNVIDWLYVDSKQNVADEATKISSDYENSRNSRWINGPSFLLSPEHFWPKEHNDTVDEDNLEEREFVFLNFTNVSNNLIVPEPDRFSKWTRLLRTTAFILRYVYNCRHEHKRLDELDVIELEKAENLLLRKIQQDSFPEEIKTLSNYGTVDRKSRLYTLDPIFEDNLIRLGGRLNNASILPKTSKRPVILDPKHKITRLIIRNEHENSNHHGQETVVIKLREKYWIISMRNAVRSCWANCQHCKNRKASQKIPVMGQLPSCRLEPTIRPFIVTGVDYFGPIEVTVKRSHEKRYGVLFTCMVTRAIHIELAHDLSTDGFIHVLRQFASRRGYPEELLSDNGKCFKGAEKELKQNVEKLNQTEITRFCTLKNVKWIYNPPVAPHMGGAWERLIGCVKKHLKEVLKSRYPQEYVLRTTLAEIENILNSRPLTHISNDPDDPEPLTPNHFLIGPAYAALPCTEINENNINLVSKWKAAQKLADLFWRRWSKEYLLSLIQRTKWHQEQKNLALGDVVLVCDPDSPRNIWPKAKVVNVFPAKDGRVRMVDVKFANGTVLRRPVARLCRLDL